MFIVFPAVLFVKSYTPDSSFENPFLKFQGLLEYFFIIKQLFIHSQIDENTFSSSSLFSCVSIILFLKLNNEYLRQNQQFRVAPERESAILAARKCTPLNAAEFG